MATISVVPAYAGVIPSLRCCLLLPLRGSRVCGGDPVRSVSEFDRTEWFPRMRG